MIFFQAAQYRPSFGYGKIMRTIMADQDKVLVKIYGMKLCKAAANAKPVHDHHGDTGFKVGLAAHGKTAGG